jgi:hypothetical protein
MLREGAMVLLNWSPMLRTKLGVPVEPLPLLPDEDEEDEGLVQAAKTATASTVPPQERTLENFIGATP